MSGRCTSTTAPTRRPAAEPIAVGAPAAALYGFVFSTAVNADGEQRMSPPIGLRRAFRLTVDSGVDYFRVDYKVVPHGPLSLAGRRRVS